jgi:hypothetical protein
LSAVWEGCSPLGEQPCPAHLTNDHPLSKMSMSLSVHTFLYMHTDGYIVVYLYLCIYIIIYSIVYLICSHQPKNHLLKRHSNPSAS